MNWRNRKLRLGILLGIAVFALVYVWRTNQQPKPAECAPGRHEVKDAAGKVVEITRTTCN